MSEKAYAKICSSELKTLDKTLKGPRVDQLACKGRLMGYLQKCDVTIKEETHVIKNLHRPLLGRPARIESAEEGRLC